ncbi:hypothetical protein [Streptomyces tritici]|uniref:hypothetical protein n=1 Tax=Streptomyces tritici TaxID=2054410 RepID=UPI003AF0E56E
MYAAVAGAGTGWRDPARARGCGPYGGAVTANLRRFEPDVHEIHLPAPATALAFTEPYPTVVMNGGLHVFRLGL